MKYPSLDFIKHDSKLLKKNKIDNRSIEDERYKVALEISDVGVWDWNIETGKIFFSEETKQIIGFSGNELKDTTDAWSDRVHPDDKSEYVNHLNLHLNGEIDTYELEYRILSKNDTYIWVLAKGKVIEKNTNGKPVRAIGIVADITSRKKNLTVLTNQNKRLQNFTHIVSHNLKTHIGNFKNILSFYDETDDAQEKAELVSHLNTISQSLTSTMTDLDDIISIKSNANSNQLNEFVNLHDCVEVITKSLSLYSTKNKVTIHNALRQDDTLFTNRSYLESVFYNLISNGIKYADPNKKSHVIIQSIHTKNTLKIIISDNGIGIDTAKFKNQIFDMYQTFHGTDRRDSRGIGLYITKIQVEALNGKIDLESTLLEGTAFFLKFNKRKALL